MAPSPAHSLIGGVPVESFSLEDLDPDQRVAATAPRGPVCILAGAGTGKTRTITYRIAHLINTGAVSPQRVLAVTFTKRAAGEMRDRLANMGIPRVQARTFHSAAMRQLAYFWPRFAGDLSYSLLDKRLPLVAQAARSCGVSTDTETLRDLTGEIEWAKATLISPDNYPEQVETFHRTPPVSGKEVGQVYAAYEELKYRHGMVLLDFDDVINQLATGIEKVQGVADEFRQQYRTFVIDEYQDVTPAQQRLVRAWLGDRDDLTVVGDANQTIYSFTGASPSFLLDFTRDYPEAVTVRLQRDYRSTPQITDVANAVISKARGRIAGTRLQLQGMKPPGQPPQFATYECEPDEAHAIAKKIQRLIETGTPPAEIAVLYRINAQSAVFEEALSDAGIVYQVRGGEGFFLRPEIRQAMSGVTRLANNQRSGDIDPVEAVTAVLRRQGMTPEEPEGQGARERWQMQNAFLALVADLVRTDSTLTLHGVLQELDRRKDAKQPPNVNGVTLASLHSAKGLEWDAVFLTGLQEGSLPIKQALKEGERQIEEERRLFYVGITRARTFLHMSWSKARSEGGRATRERTRFLDGIVPKEEDNKPVKKMQRSTRCRVCGKPLRSPEEKVLGRCVTCPEEADQALFAALRAWRTAEAKERGKPPYMIFTDATLMAIAEAMPETDAEFLSVAGVGPVKLEKFGEELREVLDEYR